MDTLLYTKYFISDNPSEEPAIIEYSSLPNHIVFEIVPKYFSLTFSEN
jgi:hypothetical protein